MASLSFSIINLLVPLAQLVTIVSLAVALQGTETKVLDLIASPEQIAKIKQFPTFPIAMITSSIILSVFFGLTHFTVKKSGAFIPLLFSLVTLGWAYALLQFAPTAEQEKEQPGITTKSYLIATAIYIAVLSGIASIFTFNRATILLTITSTVAAIIVSVI